MVDGLDVRILGRLEVLRAGQPVDLGRPRQRALFALLALHPSEVVSVDRLIEELWAGDPPGRARQSVQSYVSRLRGGLGADAIVTEGSGYKLAVAPEQVDLCRFEKLVRQARVAVQAGDPVAARVSAVAALGLVRGELLADFVDEAFVTPHASRFAEMRADALGLRFEAALATGGHDEVIVELEQTRAQHPLRERFTTQLAVALYRAGRQADALGVLQQTRTRLRDELGLDPSPELADLELAILRQDPDLGPEDARQERETPTNLPVPRSSFVGRRREIDAVRNLLDDHRLVTLTGPGGVGKTRLALRVATAELGRFPGGVFFVPLAPLTRPDQVLSAIAEAASVTVDDSSVMDRLVAVLTGNRVLLVLDNAEHLLEAGPEIAALLDATPSVHVLTTSRAPLRITGEREFPVGPVGPDEAVRIFVDRVRTHQPDYDPTGTAAQAVATLVARLDRLPLAIELSAARARVLTPEEIIDRLDTRLELASQGPRDAPQRHRTLRATVEWSTGLLDDAARAALRRLSVLRAPFDLEIAEKVIGGLPPDGEGGDRVAIVDVLEDLVTHSLLQREVEGRTTWFRMLYLIREYARQALHDSGEHQATTRRHLEAMAELAASAQPHLLGSEQTRWMHRLDAAHDDIRAAMDHALVSGDADTGLRLAIHVWRFWHRRGHLREGRRWLETLLDQASPDPRLRADGLTALAGVVYWAGDYDRAQLCYREALRIYEDLQDLRAIGDTHIALMTTARFRGLPDEMRTHQQAAYAAFEQIGDESALARAHISAGIHHVFQGRSDEGLGQLARGLPELRRSGETFWLGQSLIGALMAHLDLGNHDDARRAGSEALHIFNEAGDFPSLAQTLDWLAVLALEIDAPHRALQLAGAASAIRDEIGGGPTLADRGQGHRSPEIALAGRLPNTELLEAYRRGRELSLRDVLDLASTI